MVAAGSGRVAADEADVDHEAAEVAPEPPTRTAPRRWPAALAYVVGALAAAWPLPLHLADRIAIGTEQTSTVPLFNLWSLRWNADRLGHLYAGYWQAPIFHPARGTFAFSEPEPLTGLAFAPLHWLTGNQVLAYNLVLLAALVLNGWAAARLCRRFGVEPFVAVLMGLAAQRLPFVIDQLGVLQLVMVWPVLLTLDAALAWSAEGGRRQAALVGLGVAATFATCTYYGLFVVVLLVALVPFVVRRSWLDLGRLGEVLIGAGVFAVYAVPLLAGQQRWLGDLSWTDATVRSNSAAWGDYRGLAPRALGARLLPWVDGDTLTGQRLYPGTVFIVLAALGAWWSLRRRPTPSADGAEPGVDRRWVWYLVAGACFAGLMSLGLDLHLGGWEPYQLVRDLVPGFSRLRSPFRFAVVVQLFVLLLAALGVGRLVRRPGFGRPAAVFLVLIALAEVAGGGTGLAHVPPESTSWSSYLSHQPGDQAVAMIPFAPGPKVAEFEPTAEAMLLGLDHHKPLVNGYSGFFPGSYEQLAALEDPFPDDRALPALRRAGVRWIVVDDRWADAERQGRIDAFDALVERFHGDGKTVYELLPA